MSRLWDETKEETQSLIAPQVNVPPWSPITFNELNCIWLAAISNHCVPWCWLAVSHPVILAGASKRSCFVASRNTCGVRIVWVLWPQPTLRHPWGQYSPTPTCSLKVQIHALYKGREIRKERKRVVLHLAGEITWLVRMSWERFMI